MNKATAELAARVERLEKAHREVCGILQKLVSAQIGEGGTCPECSGYQQHFSNCGTHLLSYLVEQLRVGV